MELFNHKTKILFGENSRFYLKSLKKTKHTPLVCIATDRMVSDLGLLKLVTDVLDEENIPWKVFDEIESDPTLNHVENGLQHIINAKPNILIAVGGGSVIDASKAIMYSCLEMKRTLIEDHMVKKPEFIAIPTTSGTGSEVTSYAVITDSETKKKIPLASDDMLPDIAILDPAFTMSVPKHITAVTGMDVITHALEALMSKNATIFTDMLASESLKICLEYLEKTCSDGRYLEGRMQMHLASCMAGMAFNSSGLGAVHAFAHAIGGKYKLPHGLANTLFLTHVMRFNLLTQENYKFKKKLADVARKIQVSNSDDDHVVNALVSQIDQLIISLEIKMGLSNYGIDLDQLKEDIPRLIQQIKNDICMQTNPSEIQDCNLVKILLESY